MKKIIYLLITNLLLASFVSATTIISNDATGYSCDTACSNAGLGSCLDMGTDAAATNNKMRTYLFTCTDQSGSNCGSFAQDRSQVCNGRNAKWTNCLCDDPLDPCAYGGSGDYIVNCEACMDLNVGVNLTGYDNLYFNGTGTLTVNANILNINHTIISEGCQVNIYSEVMLQCIAL